jgi:hypothetical protein
MDSYLNSIVQTVMAQQNGDVHGKTSLNLANPNDDGSMDETMFSTQKRIDPEEMGLAMDG